jgi:predicted nucleic acid-binding protein
MVAYLDVNCVIYFIERNPRWWPITTAKIAELRAKGYQLAVSDLTRAECLVGPIKSGDAVVLQSYKSFFDDPDILVLPLTSIVCERAATIHATYGFKTPDALHLAAAIEGGSSLFLTNDIQLKRCTDISVELLA